MSFFKEIKKQEIGTEITKVSTDKVVPYTPIIDKSNNRSYMERLSHKTKIIWILIFFFAFVITAVQGLKWVTLLFEMMTKPIHLGLPQKKTWVVVTMPDPGSDAIWFSNLWSALNQSFYKVSGFIFIMIGLPIALFNLWRIKVIKKKWDHFEDLFIPILNTVYIDYKIQKGQDILAHKAALTQLTLGKFLNIKEIHKFLKERPKGLFKIYRSWRRSRNFSLFKVSLEVERFYNRTYLIQDIKELEKVNKETKDEQITEDNPKQDI